jgi:hypothetical protein
LKLVTREIMSHAGNGTHRSICGAAALIFLLSASSCSTVRELVQGDGSDGTAQTRAVHTPANFERALKENQTAVAEGKIAPDLGLFNNGVILAHPANPKKDYPRAIRSFRTLLKEHPRSAFVEQSKTWLQVLELQQELAAEKQRLTEEKRALIRDREALLQERQQLDYATQKSLQLDLEIEKRRRRSLTK